jgi:hypothetical protein
MHSLGYGALALVLLTAACGGSTAKPEASSPNAPVASASPDDTGAAHSEAKDGGTAAPTAATESVDAGASGTAPATGKGDDRPFAASSLEATHLIDEAVENRRHEMEKCAIAARERRKTPHAEIVVELGIDQEGSLIGVKSPKGAPKDKVLLDCVRECLVGAPFPRSKSGVITLKKRFTEQVVKPAPKKE